MWITGRGQLFCWERGEEVVGSGKWRVGVILCPKIEEVEVMGNFEGSYEDSYWIVVLVMWR